MFYSAIKGAPSIRVNIAGNNIKERHPQKIIKNNNDCFTQHEQYDPIWSNNAQLIINCFIKEPTKNKVKMKQQYSSIRSLSLFFV